MNSLRLDPSEPNGRSKSWKSPYSSHKVDLSQGQQNSDAYRAIHPLGVVPALETDHYTIFESVAIVLQLID